MENWQMEYIKENLPTLAALTDANTQILTFLLAEDVLSEIDVDKLVRYVV